MALLFSHMNRFDKTTILGYFWAPKCTKNFQKRDISLQIGVQRDGARPSHWEIILLRIQSCNLRVACSISFPDKNVHRYTLPKKNRKVSLFTILLKGVFDLALHSYIICSSCMGKWEGGECM